jgi:hypothetical protein
MRDCKTGVFLLRFLELPEGGMRLDDGQIEVVDEAMAEVLRQKQPWERIEIGFNLWIGACKMLTSHLSAIHPDWTEEQVRREVARRLSQMDGLSMTETWQAILRRLEP